MNASRNINIVARFFFFFTMLQIGYSQPDYIMQTAKRIMIYHSVFSRGTDFLRADMKSIQNSIIGVKPEIMDSAMYVKAMMTSKQLAYSSHTGITIELYGRLIRVVEIDPSSTAFTAGIRESDLIRGINGIFPANLLHAWTLLQSHGNIVIELQKNGLKTIVHCKTQHIPMKSVSIRTEGKMVFMNIKSFQSSVLDEYTALINQQVFDYDDTLIVDIRNTIGLGTLSAVLGMANMLIYQDMDILQYEIGSSTYTYTSTKKNNEEFKNIRILMDTTTEGHALLFAGLLYYHGNAELQGTRTGYNGKLTSMLQLQESPPMYIALPITKYVIGDQVVLHERGLEPGKLSEKVGYTMK